MTSRASLAQNVSHAARRRSLRRRAFHNPLRRVARRVPDDGRYPEAEVKVFMTVVCDVTPVFIPSPDAPPGNVVPALARLLIDLRRENLTNRIRPTMLEELPVNLVAPRMPSCSLN